MEQQQQPPKHQKPCRFFNSLRGCKKGDSCTFSHILQTPSSSSSNPSSQQAIKNQSLPHHQPKSQQHSPLPPNTHPHSHNNVIQYNINNNNNDSNGDSQRRPSRIQGGGWGGGNPSGRMKRPAPSGQNLQQPSLKVKRSPPRYTRGGTPDRGGSQSSASEDEDDEYTLSHAFKHLVVHCRHSEYDVYIGRYKHNPRIRAHPHTHTQTRLTLFSSFLHLGTIPPFRAMVNGVIRSR